MEERPAAAISHQHGQGSRNTWGARGSGFSILRPLVAAPWGRRGTWTPGPGGGPAQTAGLPPGTRWTPQGMKSPSVHGGCPLAPPSRPPRDRGQHGADLWRPDPLRSPRSSLRINRALPLASQSALSYEAGTTDVNRYQLASCKWKEGLSFRVRAREPRLPALRTRPGTQAVLGAGPAAADLRAACCRLPDILQGRGEQVQTASGRPSYRPPHGKGGTGTRQAQGTADRERLVYKPTKARPHIKIAPSASRSKPAKLQLLQHQPQRDRTHSVTISGPVSSAL